MAAITDNFEAYNNGNLSGQGNWTGDTDPQVQGGFVKSGSKAVSWPSNLDKQTHNIYAVPQAAGVQGFWLAFSDITAATGIGVWLKNGTDVICRLRNSVSGEININTGEGEFAVATGLSSSTYYHVYLEWDGATGKVRAKVGAGAWTDWYDGEVAFSEIDRFTIRCPGGGTNTAYLDDMTDETPPAINLKRSTIPFLG